VTVSFVRTLLLAAIVAAALTVLAGLGAGCGSDLNPSGPNPPPNNHPDTIPPAAVSDLRLRSATSNSFALVWTAPGDDGAAGTAAVYDVRYSGTTIDSAAWESATRVDPAVAACPKPCGQIETHVILGLDSATRYYFALKTSDECGNLSGLSNCTSGTTLDESIPPSTVNDLSADAVDDTTFRFEWTAPGDDWMAGQVSAYEIRYARDPIGDEQAWEAAKSGGSLPAARAAGEIETVLLSHGDFRASLFFALKAVDDVGNRSAISNSAAGMAYSQKLWVYPITVAAGGFTTIRFRSVGPNELEVGVHSHLGPHPCSDYLIALLAAGQFPIGVYAVTYNFFDPTSGHYFPSGEYYILLCRDQSFASAALVDFQR
jgi:hypothetical protein